MYKCQVVKSAIKENKTSCRIREGRSLCHFMSDVQGRAPGCACVTCHWPQGVMPTMSCPQQPCSAPIAHAYGFFFKESIHHIFGLLFVLWFSVFPSIIVFSKEPLLLWDAQRRTTSILSFLHQWCFRLHLLQEPPVCLSGGPVYPYGFSTAPYFRWIPFFCFLLAFFTVQISHPYTLIGNTRAWMVLASVSNEKLCSWWLSLIFPLIPFQVSAFSRVLGWWSTIYLKAREK